MLILDIKRELPNLWEFSFVYWRIQLMGLP